MWERMVQFIQTATGDLTITGEGMQILTYACYLWSLSSEGFY